MQVGETLTLSLKSCTESISQQWAHYLLDTQEWSPLPNASGAFL
jgi:hypothetical protein